MVPIFRKCSDVSWNVFLLTLDVQRKKRNIWCNFFVIIQNNAFPSRPLIGRYVRCIEWATRRVLNGPRAVYWVGRSDSNSRATFFPQSALTMDVCVQYVCVCTVCVSHSTSEHLWGGKSYIKTAWFPVNTPLWPHHTCVSAKADLALDLTGLHDWHPQRTWKNNKRGKTESPAVRPWISVSNLSCLFPDLKQCFELNAVCVWVCMCVCLCQRQLRVCASACHVNRHPQLWFLAGQEEHALQGQDRAGRGLSAVC